MGSHWLLCFVLLAAAAPMGAAQATFDAPRQRWTLASDRLQAAVALLPDGRFSLQEMRHSPSGDTWAPPAGQASSPIRLKVDAVWYGPDTPFQLISHSAESLPAGGVRQRIALQDLKNTVRITVLLEMYDLQPVLRWSLQVKNLRPVTVYMKAADMLPWTFAAGAESYAVFRVNQWTTDGKSQDFLPLETALDPAGTPVELYSGAHGLQCGWLALRDSAMRGLFAGWEFDGRARTTVRRMAADGSLSLASRVLELNHPVEPSGEFQVPPAFLGLFHGDWDEAGYRTQRFVEAVVAKPPPEGGAFPYVGWDSWAYGADVGEQALRRNAEIAARMGIELFIVDLGWARSMGDWHADRNKYPSGLRALSDYVHSLGMKFGLHFALTEAAPASPVMQENPDWTSTEQNNYHGALSLCLSHAPTRDWLIAEGIRIIDTYNPDWILQDGENMVKQCTKTSHTHDPADSNYSNAVDGINAVVSAIQRARPKVSWENCENGGNMMTFNMTRHYVTSITNDASGAYSSRQAVYGATYPFPPRYVDRYMPEQKLDSYVTNSYRFGGPWILMVKLDEMAAADLAFATGQIAAFKAQRRGIADGQVFHLAAPGPKRIDALQSYDPAEDSALAVVTRTDAVSSSYLLRPRGLVPTTRYTVWFENDGRTLSQTGEQLMRDGVRVSLSVPFSSEVVHIGVKADR